MSNLTNKKHIAFIDEYFINGFNGLQAYKKAYPNVSDDTAKVNASKLLTNTNIAIEVERRQAEHRAKYEISRDEIVDVVKTIMIDNLKVAPPYALKAAEILNKMAGLNATEKQEITHKIEQPLFGEEDKEE